MPTVEGLVFAYALYPLPPGRLPFRRWRWELWHGPTLVARRRGQPEQPVAELGGVQAQRAAGVGPGEPPAGGHEPRTVPQLPLPAPERQPARRERVEGVGELEALNGRHAPRI